MVRIRTHHIIIAITCVMCASSQVARAEVLGQQAVTKAAQNNLFSFIMFYRSNDAATQNMYRVLTSTLSEREDVAIIPVKMGDNSGQELVKRFDATRLPMPAVAVLAPNGAVCSVLPQRVTEQQLEACIVSPTQARCLKALQENKIVALCAQPTLEAEVPNGVRQFKAEEHYRDRTEIVTVLGTDPKEVKFLSQLRVPTNQKAGSIVLMAPPGVMIGVFASDVTHVQLAQKLAAAGKCCDDENCKFHNH